jgi:hypothetical protein
MILLAVTGRIVKNVISEIVQFGEGNLFTCPGCES